MLWFVLMWRDGRCAVDVHHRRESQAVERMAQGSGTGEHTNTLYIRL